jgi:hypothetical protein
VIKANQKQQPKETAKEEVKPKPKENRNLQKKHL